MKAIIVSDIHGNLEYMKKLDKLISSEIENLDYIILLGDILNNYYKYDNYEINEVAKLLNKRAGIIKCVKGNCDSQEDQKKLNFNINQEYDEIILDGIKFYLTHGHLINKYHHIFEDNYLFSGHTHVYNLEGKHLNPGSLSYPRKKPEHTCFIYENKKIKLIDLDSYNTISEIYIK